MDITEQVVDFYEGTTFLERLVAWAYVVANQQAVIERLAAFEGAYEHLAALHAAGKGGAGATDFSEENRARIRRINELIRDGFSGEGGRRAAPEVHALAEESLRGLLGTSAAAVGDRERAPR